MCETVAAAAVGEGERRADEDGTKPLVMIGSLSDWRVEDELAIREEWKLATDELPCDDVSAPSEADRSM